MRVIILIFTFFILSQVSSLQAQLTTGSITMSLKDFGMEGIDGAGGADQMAGMMESMTMIMHFKPEKQVTEISMMGLINMKQHIEDGVMTQYMDMMGQKIKMNMPIGDGALKDLGLSQEQMKDAYDISYDKSTTKNIAGYDCYQATVNMDLSKLSGEVTSEMPNMSVTMYLTDDIKMDNFNMQQLPGLELEGTPLSMTMDMGMMKMTFEATEVKTDVDPAVFEIPAGDYKEMSLEDLQQLGMNPGSFGF